MLNQSPSGWYFGSINALSSNYKPHGGDSLLAKFRPHGALIRHIYIVSTIISPQ
jgi:hypothetical protein